MEIAYLDRRTFLRLAGLAALPNVSAAAEADGVVVNDVHSQMNATRVNRVVERPVAVRLLYSTTSPALSRSNARSETSSPMSRMNFAPRLPPFRDTSKRCWTTRHRSVFKLASFSPPF